MCQSSSFRLLPRAKLLDTCGVHNKHSPIRYLKKTEHRPSGKSPVLEFSNWSLVALNWGKSLELELEIGIGSWSWKLELEVGVGNWNWKLELDAAL